MKWDIKRVVKFYFIIASMLVGLSAISYLITESYDLFVSIFWGGIAFALLGILGSLYDYLRMRK